MSRGRIQLWSAKRCGTAIFGKLFASCFYVLAAPRKRGSDLDRNWYDSRAHRRPRGDWILASLIWCGIFGDDKKSQLFDPWANFIRHLFYIRWRKLSDRCDCPGRPINTLSQAMLRLSRAGNVPKQHDSRTLVLQAVFPGLGVIVRVALERQGVLSRPLNGLGYS